MVLPPTRGSFVSTHSGQGRGLLSGPGGLVSHGWTHQPCPQGYFRRVPGEFLAHVPVARCAVESSTCGVPASTSESVLRALLVLFGFLKVSWDFSLAAREGAYLFIQVLATGACGGAVCVCDVDSVCACLVVCSHCVYLRVRVHTCRQ